MRKNDIYTDLASEMIEGGGENKGVRLQEETKDGITITKVEILSEEGAKSIGKPMGKYVTVSSPMLCSGDPQSVKELSIIISNELSQLLPFKGKRAEILVLGLGNSAFSADALGGSCVKNIFVSRHMIENIPDAVDERAGSVAAIAPGVLGVTGIETGEIALGLVEKLKPQCVIAVDSLAAMSSKRLLSTVQITNTGICPGSGLNSKRKELTYATLSVPVIAIGVPMVVSALALCGKDCDNDIADLIVTPKDIDDAVKKAAYVIAMGINLAVHRGISFEEFSSMLS
ncbi:MAG: GPR endopeptidase [Clostridiales bacterium]|nr:GPR endopeptidase [Clostridiales bacterium]